MKPLLLAFWPLLAATAQPSLDEILARLADNQERANSARKSIVYRQDSFVRLLRTNGKLSREEKRQYTVAPTEKGSSKHLDHFEGRYERGGRILPYDQPGFQYKDTDIDGGIIEDFTDDLINDKKTRDGLAKSMFPLTRAEQRYYSFKLNGLKKIAGAEAWHVSFEPRKRSDDEEEGDQRAWAGDVYIDPVEFQPRLVATRLSLKIPAAVKIIFGIDIKQLGFQVTYAKVADGLWFPATYGTEFGLKVLFGYKRNITMNVTNSEFRRTSADSTITFVGPESSQGLP